MWACGFRLSSNVPVLLIGFELSPQSLFSVVVFFVEEVTVMFHLGVDIGKQAHYACLIDESGKAIVQPFKFTVDAKGFDKFLSKFMEWDKQELSVMGTDNIDHISLSDSCCPESCTSSKRSSCCYCE